MRKISIAVLIVFLFFVASTKIYAVKNASAGASAQLQTTTLLVKEDYSRVKILRDFLTKQSSPLASFAYDFIKNANDYSLDWRLIAAISGIESTFGQQIPYKSYNAWGWGVYGDNVIYFSSWQEGIETVSKALRENYINKWGAKNVYEIGRIYAASPTWASRVEYFMAKITEFENQNLVYNLSISL